MGEAGVTEKTQQGLVELDPRGSLGAVRGDRALRALRRDRTGAVGEQEAGQGAECEQVVRAGPAPEQGGGGDLGQGAFGDQRVAADAAEGIGLMCRGGDRGTEHRRHESQPARQRLDRQAGDALAPEGSPADGRGDGGKDRIRPRIAALGEQPAQRKRTRPARLDAPDHRGRQRVRRIAQHVGGQVRAELDPFDGKCFVGRVADTGRGERIDQAVCEALRRREQARADDADCGRKHRIGRVAGLARGLGGDEHRAAVQVHVDGNGDIDQRLVVRAGRLAQQGEPEVRFEWLLCRLQHADAVQARDLGLRIHLRGAGGVLQRLPWKHRAELAVESADLAAVGLDRVDHRQVDRLRERHAHVAAEPGLEVHRAFRLEVRQRRIGAHYRRQRGRDVGDVGDHRAPRREHRVVGRIEPFDAELLHEPAFLGLGIVVAARHRAGVADRAGELGLPAADHAGDHRLGEVGVEFVVAARLGIQHGRLAAGVVGERKGELGRGVVDVDILAAGDQRGRAPAGHAQVLRDGRGEAAGVRQDCDRTALERVARVVAPEGTADSHLVPRIGHAEAVGAEHVDTGLLRHRADLAGVMDRDLLGDDEDLGEFGIHPDQLGHAVARGAGRQIDHAAVEAVAVVEALAHAVIDRDRAGRGVEGLAAAPRRGAEHDVAARPGVADRGDLGRFAAENVEHADAVLARRDLGQRADAHEVLEVAVALLVHVGSPLSFRLQAARAGAAPRRAAISSRPPAFIQSLMRRA